MSVDKPAFVLVHGYWHNSGCWRDVSARLEAGGYEVVTPDLPGAGVHARVPVSFLSARSIWQPLPSNPLRTLS